MLKLEDENSHLRSKIQDTSSDTCVNTLYHSEISEPIMNANDHHAMDSPTSDTCPPLEFKSSLEQLFPRKSLTLPLPLWNNPNHSSLRATQKQKYPN